jgi:hypothetical protein
MKINKDIKNYYVHIVFFGFSINCNSNKLTIFLQFRNQHE